MLWTGQYEVLTSSTPKKPNPNFKLLSSQPHIWLRGIMNLLWFLKGQNRNKLHEERSLTMDQDSCDNMSRLCCWTDQLFKKLLSTAWLERSTKEDNTSTALTGRSCKAKRIPVFIISTDERMYIMDSVLYVIKNYNISDM